MSDDIDPVVRQWLAELDRDDIRTLRRGLPIIRMVVSFGIVSKWIAITLGGLLLGGVMLWDAVLKIAMWIRGNG